MPPQQAFHRGYVPQSRSATSTLSVPPPHLGTFGPLASDCSASHPSRTSTFVVPTDPWSAKNASQNCVTCPSISLATTTVRTEISSPRGRLTGTTSHRGLRHRSTPIPCSLAGPSDN